MVLLVKADTGYINDSYTHTSDEIRSFLQNQMGLDKFVYMASTSFNDVSYYSVSAKVQVENDISGIDTILHDLFSKLKIEWEK